jgi:hypothetical protein
MDHFDNERAFLVMYIASDMFTSHEVRRVGGEYCMCWKGG